MNETKFYYELHVTGKNSFSTCVIADEELDESDVIMLAIDQDRIDSDDIHYIDYIKEISFDEWDINFNLNK